MSNTTATTMKTKIQSFKPNLQNMMLMDSVLRTAIRNAYSNRNKGLLSVYKKWRKDDLRDTIKAYRIIKATEVSNVH
jgi:hypothetical protein